MFVPVPVTVTVFLSAVLVSDDRRYLRKTHASVRDHYFDQQRIDGGRAPLRIRGRISSGWSLPILQSDSYGHASPGRSELQPVGHQIVYDLRHLVSVHIHHDVIAGSTVRWIHCILVPPSSILREDRLA